MVSIESGSHGDSRIIISDAVIETIVFNSARDTEGVAAVCPFEDARKRLPGASGAPVHVVEREDGLQVSLGVVLADAHPIPETAARIQRNVKEALQSMTGSVVDRVDVTVTDVSFDLT